MWDKSLDEGIFLCEHESHILTADFLQSLKYVQNQVEINNWIEPNQFITNKLEFIAYILIKNDSKIADQIFYKGQSIELSNKKQNDIFQDQIFQDHWDNQLFIYKLFEPKEVYDTICARCGDFLNTWDSECKICIDWEIWEFDGITPSIGTVNCSECDGNRFYWDCRLITHYCEYNIKTGERDRICCMECAKHFE